MTCLRPSVAKIRLQLTCLQVCCWMEFWRFARSAVRFEVITHKHYPCLQLDHLDADFWARVKTFGKLGSDETLRIANCSAPRCEAIYFSPGLKDCRQLCS